MLQFLPFLPFLQTRTEAAFGLQDAGSEVGSDVGSDVGLPPLVEQRQCVSGHVLALPWMLHTLLHHLVTLSWPAQAPVATQSFTGNFAAATARTEEEMAAKTRRIFPKDPWTRKCSRCVVCSVQREQSTLGDRVGTAGRAFVSGG